MNIFARQVRLPKVFIAHGHAHAARDELKKMLTELGTRPIVLAHEPDFGDTIIAKFEHYASECEFAVILLTPDDKNAKLLPAKERFRARQNVIFEMGWFFAKLQRSRTLLIYKGDVELPSDVTGILYKEFKQSPRELFEELKTALQAGAVRIVEPISPNP